MANKSERLAPETPSSDKAVSTIDSIYRSYCEAVRRYTLRHFGLGPPDPDDVVHAAFESFAQIEISETVQNPYSFLVRCARNYVIDQRRRLKVRAEHAADVFATRVEFDDRDAERVLASKQEVAIVAHAIAGLDDRRREMLLMNRIEGLSYAEISRRLGCSEGLVKLRVGEAVLLCREAVDRRGAV